MKRLRQSLEHIQMLKRKMKQLNSQFQLFVSLVLKVEKGYHCDAVQFLVLKNCHFAELFLSKYTCSCGKHILVKISVFFYHSVFWPHHVHSKSKRRHVYSTPCHGVSHEKRVSSIQSYSQAAMN